MEARIWIEAEHLAEDVTDFCNIAVYLSTGERYALNVWTFDFFAVAQGRGRDARIASRETFVHVSARLVRAGPDPANDRKDCDRCLGTGSAAAVALDARRSARCRRHAPLRSPHLEAIALGEFRQCDGDQVGWWF